MVVSSFFWFQFQYFRIRRRRKENFLEFQKKESQPWTWRNFCSESSCGTSSYTLSPHHALQCGISEWWPVSMEVWPYVETRSQQINSGPRVWHQTQMAVQVCVDVHASKRNSGIAKQKCHKDTQTTEIWIFFFTCYESKHLTTWTINTALLIVNC